MREWADSPPSRHVVRVRCVEPQRARYSPGLDEFPPDGCGWGGNAEALTELGTTTYRPEECPECGGELELDGVLVREER